MQQLNLFQEIGSEQIVNVASVPQRSPFRYPGGKTWFVPHIRRWFSCFDTRPNELIEPFTGGGSISLAAAFEQLTNTVKMVEIDEDVASVWKTILDGNVEQLASRIESFEMNIENVKEVLFQSPISCEDRAFHTILRNRVNRGGILAAGTGLIKNGENGKGISSRWYPETLKKRILAIAAQNNINFVEGDGLKVLRENVDREDVVFFIDPPYTAGGKNAGKRLYKHSELDHEELFRTASSLRGQFLMTYDNTREIREKAQRYNFVFKAVSMKNTHHSKLTELIISRTEDF
ncbi:DNA adenine methylase [Microcoleus sp. FACHB-1515]|uniref:DNA adenine methylase n=1 Tax=Cyanophyceae TaxID=3028117 RepID=UPI001684AA3D|nr:DNA adenine methylase [Microcoleus sp. FACHB-1515]MBD2090274.1 DNA adenine methylase [Microcoleus sp. FACHB-1515]